ncbi:c-type cytochrome [Herbaspirillum sp. C9C3]|uniref:c-type cytochrome n=1 Tax=Herbaspirillum sp. C9C3 TaxID=2735271 RepID=UPI001584CF65|nr:c-type cytochrome [Herbaspirillum sp. C9C3]NUT59922.1 c-type cytochrome [Herbaspirillum sp. C9C3]
MSRQNKSVQRQRHQVDESFEPWERARPIPIFVLAILIALATWGAMTYWRGFVPSPAAQPVDASQQAQASFEQVDSSAPDVVRVGSATVWSCASCHGGQGQGSGQTPRLAGLSQRYMSKQLRDFAEGTRLNESMRYVVTQLSAEELAEAARYYSGLAPLAPSAYASVDPQSQSLKRGKHLQEEGDWDRNIPACFTCHGKQAEGVGDDFPRLAGQQPEYLLSQLTAWKGGARHNSAQALMDDIAKRMSNDDMWAVAQYLATLK